MSIAHAAKTGSGSRPIPLVVISEWPPGESHDSTTCDVCSCVMLPRRRSWLVSETESIQAPSLQELHYLGMLPASDLAPFGKTLAPGFMTGAMEPVGHRACCVAIWFDLGR